MASQRLKHGLTASTLVVLPEEHEHEYQEVLRGFRESFQPHDPAEHALVLRLAQTHWRSLRSRRLKQAFSASQPTLNATTPTTLSRTAPIRILSTRTRPSPWPS